MNLQLAIERIFPRVGLITGPRANEIGDCWEWSGATTGGYGELRFDGSTLYVHRVMYEVAVGPIPDGMLVRHKCDNRRCCRPGHLELGTFADNSRDMVERKRSTKGRPQHPNGHMTGEKHGRSKLTAEQVAEIRKRYAAGGITQTELGKEYGISGTHVCGIVKGKYWNEGPEGVPPLQPAVCESS